MAKRPVFSRREWLLLTAQLSAQTALSPSVEPHYWTLCEAANQIRRRKISAEELTRLCLERVRQRDTLNAFITVTAESALEQARSLDRDLKRGLIRGPLHGVPVALKDNIDTAGLKTTAAAELFANRVPTEDAEVARRIFQAGAVSLGKLNLDEFAFAGTGTTGYFGPARNLESDIARTAA